MKISILSIGDELLRGSTVNTNLADIGQELGAVALFPGHEMCVPDTRAGIFTGLDTLLPLSDVIIATGGLGPTSDDITKNAVAEYLGLGIYEDQEVVEHLKMWWAKLRRGAMPKAVMSQALVPDGAQVMPNNNGTAPGLHIFNSAKLDGKRIFMLPGPPHECMPIVKESVIPALLKLVKVNLHTEIIYVIGVPESHAEEKAAPFIEGENDLTLAYCASPECVKIFLSGPDKHSVKTKMAQIKAAFGIDALSPGCKTVQEEIAALMKKHGGTLATAESCTGGMIAAYLTAIPGASEHFAGSAVVYSNDLKMKMLGVKKETLEKFGAVSAECAEELAANLCAKFAVDAGIAVTGIAGPGGGTKEKPVGLVYIATQLDGRREVLQHHFFGNREIIRRRTVTMALNQLRKMF